MVWPIDIVADMGNEKFSEIFSVNPRNVREALFSKLGIKAQSRRVGLRVGSKNAERVKILYERLIKQDSKVELELASELLRNWLYTKREMLVDTMEHFEIKHDNGLTEQDIDFIEKLEREKVDELCAVLLPKHDQEQVSIYLRYLKVPEAKEAVAANKV